MPFIYIFCTILVLFHKAEYYVIGLSYLIPMIFFLVLTERHILPRVYVQVKEISCLSFYQRYMCA